MKKIGLCAPYQFDFAESSGSVFPVGMEFSSIRFIAAPTAIQQRAGLHDRLFVVLLFFAESNKKSRPGFISQIGSHLIVRFKVKSHFCLDISCLN